LNKTEKAIIGLCTNELLENEDRALSLGAVNYPLPHYFSPSKENDRFCECGKYLTDDCHKRQL